MTRLWALSLIPFLVQTPPVTQEQVHAILDTVQADTDMLTREQQYYQLAQGQLLSDAALVYASSSPQIIYAEFTQDTPGLDTGFGLHVIKRVDIGEKTIFINEAWPFLEGRLQPPNEIRIRTRLFFKPGTPRGQSGSEQQYLMGRYRIGWDQEDQPHFFEETGYVGPRVKAQRRVVANIFNCMSCHFSGNPFAPRFTQKQGEVDHESVVQPDYFALPVTRQRGYTDLMTYLDRQKLPADRLARMKAALARPLASFHAPTMNQSMVSAMRDKVEAASFDWLPSDEQFTDDVNQLSPSERRDGIYSKSGLLWRDSVDELLADRFGKYFRWIANHGAVPE